MPSLFQGLYGPLIGNQPPGKMITSYSSISLDGYESCGSINITYKFEDGIQGPEHPTPGKKYCGTTRSAFLPDNEEGNKVVKLLQQAFKQKLTFTIGRSSTSGLNNVITWNDFTTKLEELEEQRGITNTLYTCLREELVAVAS